MKKRIRILYFIIGALVLTGAIYFGRFPERWEVWRFQRAYRAADSQVIAICIEDCADLGHSIQATVDTRLLEAMDRLQSGARRVKQMESFWLDEQRVYLLRIRLDGGEGYDYLLTIPEPGTGPQSCAYLSPPNSMFDYPLAEYAALFRAADEIYCSAGPQD